MRIQVSKEEAASPSPAIAPKSDSGLAPDRKSALKAAITPERGAQGGNGLLSAVSTRRLKDPEKHTAQPAKMDQEGKAASSGHVEADTPLKAAQSSSPRDFKSLREARDQRLKHTAPKPGQEASITQTETTSLSPQAKDSPRPATTSSLKKAAAPRNMYEFEIRWTNDKDLESRSSMIVSLVKQHLSLDIFFGSSLTPELLDEILTCLDSA